MFGLFNKSNEAEAVVYIYPSEVNAIIAEAQRFPSSETGGDLYGSFTHGNMPVVWLASGPGPKAKHQNTHFEQDVEFTNFWQQYLSQHYGIQYIGSWHSHHILNLNHPSGGDVESARTYAKKHGRRRTLEIIVNHEGNPYETVPRPYFYPNAIEYSWVRTKFSYLSGASPLRSKLEDKETIFSPNIDHRRIYQLDTRKDSKKTEQDVASANLLEGTFPSSKDDNYPPLLLKAVEFIASENIKGIEIEQRGNIYMVIVNIDDEKILAIAIEESKSLCIVQINLISNSQSEDITNKVKQRGIPLVIDRKSIDVLKEILGLMKYISNGENYGNVGRS